MPSTDKRARRFEKSHANNPNATLFAARYRSVNAKCQSYLTRIEAARNTLKNARDCVTHAKALVKSHTEYLESAEHELDALPETHEFTFIAACLKSLNKASSPNYEAEPGVMYSSTIILHNPTSCPGMNAINLIQVESVNFGSGILVFTDADIQRAWSLVQHLFRIEPLETVYELRRTDAFEANIDEKDDLKKWAIGGCLSNDIGFLDRTWTSTEVSLDQPWMSFEVDHSEFVSLCATQMRLDLGLFDKAQVVFDAGLCKDSQHASATLQLIAIKPLPKASAVTEE